jgi:hypothetical protein
MKNTTSVILCTLSVILTLSCQKQPKATVIVRVGDAALTLEDAKSHIDTSRQPYNDQIQKYMMQWVNEELVNQEAKRKGIENDERFRYRMQEANRILVNQYFLAQYFYSDTVDIKEELIQEYFKNHLTEFIVQEDVIKMNTVTFSTRDRASSFAASILHGTSWSNAVDAVLGDPSSGIISNSIGKQYTQRTLFPVELWRVASTLKPSEVSFPVKTSNGFSVLMLISILKKGEQTEYAFVRDEVRERVLLEQRRKRYTDLIENLHQKYKVEMLFNPMINPDSDKIISHE